jgi:hypothetical protein
LLLLQGLALGPQLGFGGIARQPGGAAATELGYNFTDIFLDSPATTSSTTYKVQYKSDSTFTLELQYQNSNSQIILMEIGA